MKRFLKLLRKDLEASRLPVFFLAGITLILMAVLRWRIAQGAWHPQVSVLGVAVPLTFFPLWLIWRSFQTLRAEWREDTVYTLLVLPVPGWQVLLAKLAGLLVEYSVLFAATVGGTFLFFGGLMDELWEVIPGPWWLAWNALWVYVTGAFVLATLAIHVQLAFVVSKMVGRLQGLVALWVLFLSTWLTDRAALLLEPLFRWLPTIRLHEFLQLTRFDEGIILEWQPAGQIGAAFATVGLLFLTGLLFERFLEING
ncbi:MAG TPA: hypothetical protein PLM25_08250 [Limnochordia bacterium]|nr:hypothetical protein [Limnochordia bacterium]